MLFKVLRSSFITTVTLWLVFTSIAVALNFSANKDVQLPMQIIIIWLTGAILTGWLVHIILQSLYIIIFKRSYDIVIPTKASSWPEDRRGVQDMLVSYLQLALTGIIWILIILLYKNISP